MSANIRSTLNAVPEYDMSRANFVAFPVPGLQDDETFNGLTIREYFAAMAMQGLLAQEAEGWSYSDPAKLAKAAVARADALIAELSK